MATDDDDDDDNSALPVYGHTDRRFAHNMPCCCMIKSPLRVLESSDAFSLSASFPRCLPRPLLASLDPSNLRLMFPLSGVPISTRGSVGHVPS